MKKDFDIPKLRNEEVELTIYRCLNTIASCAFYIAGDDQMGLKNSAEIYSGWCVEEYKPEETYIEAHDELFGIVYRYNQFIIENNLDEQEIRILVDGEKTALLNDSSEYQIFKVVLI